MTVTRLKQQRVEFFDAMNDWSRPCIASSLYCTHTVDGIRVGKSKGKVSKITVALHTVNPELGARS